MIQPPVSRVWPTAPGEESESVARGRCIGVVDDDPSILRAVRRLLGAAGFTVRTFGSGEQFLACEALATIDCVVLDIHLGGLNGFEVQERLAGLRPCLPIVFITAHDDRATRERAHRGVNSRYLRKPFEEQALVDAIHALLDGA